MKQFQIIFTLLLAANLNLFGQIEHGIKLGIGASKVNIVKNYSRDEFETRPGISSEIGYFTDIPLSKRFVFRTGLNLSLILNREVEESTTSGNGETYYLEYKYIRNMYYAGVPLTIGVKLKKVQLHLGIQGNVKIDYSEVWKTYVDKEYIDSRKPNRTLNLSNFDMGMKFGLFYGVSKRISLETYYYHGLIDVLTDRESQWKIRQLTIGLSYKIGSQHKRK